MQVALILVDQKKIPEFITKADHKQTPFIIRHKKRTGISTLCSFNRISNNISYNRQNSTP